MSVTTKDIQGGSQTSRLKGHGYQPTTLARTSPCSISPTQLAYWPQRGAAWDGQGQTLVLTGPSRGACHSAFKAKATVPKFKT